MIVESIPSKRVDNINQDIRLSAVFLLSDNLSLYITCANIMLDRGIRLSDRGIYTKREIDSYVNN